MSQRNSHVILIDGPVVYSAMFLDQSDGNQKAIQWLGPPKPGTNVRPGGAIYVDPATGDFTIGASGDVNLSQKSTFNQCGLSATPIPARSLRGVGVPVPGGASSLTVTLATPEHDANYAIMTQCNWLTATAVQHKTARGFTVLFDKAAPLSGSVLDWFLVR
jgi:hypothetical protein